MSNTCDSCFYHVYDYLDRELGRWSRWKIQRHLHKCPECAEAYGFEERLLVLVKTHLKEECPPEVITRIRQVIHDES